MSAADGGWRGGCARCLLTVAMGLALSSVQSVPAVAAEKANPEVLTGAWVRPDGGYVILIKGVQGNGQLDASYFNPHPLPFAKAQAAVQGGMLRTHFELQAGGYAGSTYNLTYDPATDRLKGVYYQAVAKQKFDVHFERKTSGTIRQP